MTFCPGKFLLHLFIGLFFQWRTMTENRYIEVIFQGFEGALMSCFEAFINSAVFFVILKPGIDECQAIILDQKDIDNPWETW